MTPQEELALVVRAKAGDDRARDRLVAARWSDLQAKARRYARTMQWLDADDLTQVGALALLSAIRLFDPARSDNFWTYAGYIIQKALCRHITTRESLMPVPRRLVENRRALERAQREQEQRTGRHAPLDELARERGMAKGDWLDASATQRLGMRLDSVAVASEDGGLDALALDIRDYGAQEAIEAAAGAGVLGRRVDALLGLLTGRERHVVVRAYGLDGEPPETCREYAERTGEPFWGVRSVEATALRRLRCFHVNA